MTGWTLARLKRELRPGVMIRIVNHVRPQASRLATVLGGTNTVELVTTRARGDSRPSHLRWPKAKDVRGGDDDQTVHIDSDGQPFLTITILEEA